MTAASTPGASAPPSPPPAEPGRGTGAWRLRPWAVRVMISLELRQRVRSKRWYVALGIWTLFLIAMTALLFAASQVLGGGDPQMIGSLLFSLVILLAVFTLMLVLPALSAGSINGDRSAGTLATLQTTLISPVEIVAGKVLAGWLVGLAFLVAALPSILPTAVLAGNSPLYVLRVMLMLAVLSLLVTMVGVGASSLAGRQLGSVVLTYLIVMGTMLILPIVFVTTLPFLSTEDVGTVYQERYEEEDGDFSTVGPGECFPTEQEREILRTDRTLPLLWGNPFVLVAEMAPDVPQTDRVDLDVAPDALQVIREGMRQGSDPDHPSHFVYCSEDMPGYPTDLGEPGSRPVWPQGLALWTIAGLGASFLAIRRLQVPMRRVGAGTRIA